MSATELAAAAKARGNAAFSKQDFKTAIAEYTQAISHDPTQHALYSNRAACYTSLTQYTEALADAEKCVSIAPQWPKGYNRKAVALYNLDRLEESKTACEAGLKLSPNDAGLTDTLATTNKALDGNNNPMGKLFGPSMWGKLAADPTTAPYLQDQAFTQKMNMIAQNPNMFTQFMQSDPKVSQAISVLLGLGAAGFSAAGAPGGPGASPADEAEDEEFMRQREMEQERARLAAEEAERARTRAKAAADEKKRVEEEKKREEEEKLANMSQEEKDAIVNKARALEVKDQGNKAYTSKKFDEALALYNQAITLDPTNATFHTNIAAVLMAKRDFDGCITACNRGLEVGRENGYLDFKFVAKTYLRIANANLLKKDYAAAITAYDQSLLENYTDEAKMKRKKANAAWTKQKKAEYLNPELALEAKQRGNKFYSANDYPNAIEAYTEAVERDPTNHVFYSNRANCYAKLMQFGSAIKDCEECIKLCPSFSKIYIRKGKIQHFLKQYKSAIETFDIGLHYDPTSSELNESKRATLMKIQEENMSGNVDPERQRQAMQDPEIQQIMRDPTISNILERMQTDPASAQAALRDPEIAAKIQKLIQAGILRTG